MNIVKQRLRVCKPILFTCLIAFILITVSAGADHAAPASPLPGIDTTHLPITAADLRTQLQACRTQTDFYEAIQRGHENLLDPVVIEETRSLKDKSPDDPLLLSAYCMALQTDNDQDRLDEYHTDLKKALKLGPNLWMPLVLQGTSILWYRDTDRGLDMLRKAVELASDISITHLYLARGYSFCITAKHMSPRNEEVELVKASRLQPVISDVYFCELVLYMSALESRSKALAAKHAYLAAVPPGNLPGLDAQIITEEFASLDKYGSKMPK